MTKFTIFSISLVLIIFLGACSPAEKKVIKNDAETKVYPNQPKNSESQPNKIEPEKMNESNEAEKAQKFYNALDKILPKRGLKTATLCDQNDSVSKRILEEYGSFFVASESVSPPPACMFTTAEEVNQFQAKAGISSENISGANVELQPNAMKALLSAIEEAKSQGLTITPRGGQEAARRSFDDTLRLWKSRFEFSLKFWQEKGKISVEQSEKLLSLPIKEQVREVLELEKNGIFFNKSLRPDGSILNEKADRSILYSVAAPGTSQHLSMLALDVEEFENKKVRDILANHGWFRTVQNDNPHFTYLGRSEAELERFGLKKIEKDTGEYWIPNV